MLFLAIQLLVFLHGYFASHSLRLSVLLLRHYLHVLLTVGQVHQTRLLTGGLEANGIASFLEECFNAVALRIDCIVQLGCSGHFKVRIPIRVYFHVRIIFTVSDI